MNEALTQSTWLLPFFALLLGLTVGSFLNVVIYRLPLMMEAGWRRTNAELERLGTEVSQLREVVSDASDALSGAKIEVRLRGDTDDRNGHTTKWERWSAANRPAPRQTRQPGRSGHH